MISGTGSIGALGHGFAECMLTYLRIVLRLAVFWSLGLVGFLNSDASFLASGLGAASPDAPKIRVGVCVCVRARACACVHAHGCRGGGADLASGKNRSES